MRAGPSRTSYDAGSIDAEPYGAVRLQPVAIEDIKERSTTQLLRV